jgi:endonuclease IV
MRRIGVHTSIAGGIRKGLERAIELGCNTLQIFSHNPRGWAVKETNGGIKFQKLRMNLIFHLFSSIRHSDKSCFSE